jgi:hypothetical protein
MVLLFYLSAMIHVDSLIIEFEFLKRSQFRFVDLLFYKWQIFEIYANRNIKKTSKKIKI